jgi:hypothetical protein
VDSCLEGKEKRGLENVRGRRRKRTQQEKRKNSVKPSSNLVRFEKYGS